MQKQEHVNEKQQSVNQIGRSGEVFSFQEVVYPPAEKNRWLNWCLASGWRQYFFGAGIGVVSVGATLAVFIFFVSVSLFRPEIPRSGIIALIILFAIIIAYIIGIIVCLSVQRLLFVGCGLLSMIPVAVLFFILIFHGGL